MWLWRAVLAGTVLGFSVTHADQVREPRHVALVTLRDASTTAPALRGAAHPASPTRAEQPDGSLPLSFEANQGQADGQVRFLTRGRGYALFLTSTEAVLALSRPESQTFAARGHRERLLQRSAVGARRRASRIPSERTAVTVLRIRLEGARAAPRVTGLDELPGKVNYFIGREPARWRTNVSTYARVKYEDVYPGIDLVYYGNHRQLEYDFAVAPGADPRTIGLAFEGADGLEIDANGDLRIRVPGGEVRQKKPFVYQERGGVREAIAGAYVRTGPRQVGFLVPAYDASRPLVIDPQLAYSTYLAGGDFDSGLAIAVDSFGNAYVAGQTYSTNFPTTGGALRTSLRGSSDAFVTKLNATGSVAVYSTYLGGRGWDSGFGIAVDSAGNAYVTGSTLSTDFPTTTGAFQRTLRVNPADPDSSEDAFVTKLNATGSALVYSTYLGGPDVDWGVRIAVDSSRRAYVTGSTYSRDFPVTPGAFLTVFPAGSGQAQNAFVVKLNASGSDLVYSTFLGGDDAGSTSVATGIAVDSSGSAYVVGGTSSARFPTSAGAVQTRFGGAVHSSPGVSGDAFVTKLNATGSALVYSTYLGGSEDDFASAIAIDTSGNAYVTGATLSGNFPTVNPIQPPLPGRFADKTVFVTKVDPSGSALVYSTVFGGTPLSGEGDGSSRVPSDLSTGIAVDSSGNAYISGLTISPEFPTTQGAFQRVLRGVADAFVVKLDPAGSALLYSTYLGGDDVDWAEAIALDASGNAYVTGIAGWSSHEPTNFPTTAGAFQVTPGGRQGDAFVAKISIEAGSIPLRFVSFPVTFPSLPREGQIGVPYVGNIGIGGGRPPYEIAVVAGALPRGLRFSSPGITGTPIEILTALFTAQVRDALGSLSEQKEFQITVFPPPAVPLLRVIPTPLDFGLGEVPTGSSAEVVLTVSNEGVGSLVGNATAAPPFGVVSGASFSLDGGQSQDVTVRFTPEGAGAATGGVSFLSNGGRNTAVVRGIGTLGQTLTVGTAGAGVGTVTSDPAGIDCRAGSVCSATFVSGSASFVFLSAVAEIGSVFSGWSGACTGTGGCVVTMNAARSVTATFVPRPDVIVAALTLGTTSGAPGSRLGVTVEVRNQGLLAAGRTMTRFYLSRYGVHGVKGQRARLLAPSQVVPALAAGSSLTQVARLALPRTIAAGGYFVVACTDDLQRVAEGDESNNCRAAGTTLRITGPDLVVEAVTPRAASVQAGDRLVVDLGIRNAGDLIARSSVARFYLSAHGTRDGADRLLTGTRTVGVLAAGARQDGTAVVGVPAAMPAGEYYVLACADDLARLVETDDGNNCLASATTVTVIPR